MLERDYKNAFGKKVPFWMKLQKIVVKKNSFCKKLAKDILIISIGWYRIYFVGYYIKLFQRGK